MQGSFKLTAVAQKAQSENVKADNPVTLGRKGTLSVNSRYGTALINLKELQDDSFEAFAVGAPFEDGGRGAIYIYYGSQSFWRGDGLSKGTKLENK